MTRTMRSAVVGSALCLCGCRWRYKCVRAANEVKCRNRSILAAVAFSIPELSPIGPLIYYTSTLSHWTERERKQLELIRTILLSSLLKVVYGVWLGRLYRREFWSSIVRTARGVHRTCGTVYFLSSQCRSIVDGDPDGRQKGCKVLRERKYLFWTLGSELTGAIGADERPSTAHGCCHPGGVEVHGNHAGHARHCARGRTSGESFAPFRNRISQFLNLNVMLELLFSLLGSGSP